MTHAGTEKWHLDLEKDLSSLQLFAYQRVLEEKKTSETWRIIPARCSGVYAYLGEANRLCLHFQHFFFPWSFPGGMLYSQMGNCILVLLYCPSWRAQRIRTDTTAGGDGEDQDSIWVLFWCRIYTASSITLPMKWCPWSLSCISPPLFHFPNDPNPFPVLSKYLSFTMTASAYCTEMSVYTRSFQEMLH